MVIEIATILDKSLRESIHNFSIHDSIHNFQHWNTLFC